MTSIQIIAVSICQKPFHFQAFPATEHVLLLTQAVKGAMLISPSRDDCEAHLRFQGYLDAQHLLKTYARSHRKFVVGHTGTWNSKSQSRSGLQ